VGNVRDYDSTTGIGDASYTVYYGGKCIAATFDSTGATKCCSYTTHFVVTDQNRVDSIFTTLTDPVGGLGGFSLSKTELRQNSKRGE